LTTYLTQLFLQQSAALFTFFTPHLEGKKGLWLSVGVTSGNSIYYLVSYHLKEPISLISESKNRFRSGCWPREI